MYVCIYVCSNEISSNLDMVTLHTWEFDALSVPTDLLPVYACTMFEHFYALQTLHIRGRTLSLFMQNVQKSYINTNDYHNFMHISFFRLYYIYTYIYIIIILVIVYLSFFFYFLWYSIIIMVIIIIVYLPVFYLRVDYYYYY